MVKAELKKVVIKNFKSLHDCEIDVGKLNVVVGANASGKSNLIEAFRLLKKIYVDKDSFPFLEWWGYSNVVWQRKEELPIVIGLTFDIEGYEVYFETNFTGVGQKFQILREILDVRDYVKIYKEGEWITIKHDLNFILSLIKNLDEYETDYGSKVNLRKNKNKLTQERKFRTDLDKRLLDGYHTGYVNTVVFPSWGGFKLTQKKTGKKFVFSEIRQPITKKEAKSEEIHILCPAIPDPENKYYTPQIFIISMDMILSIFNKLLILYPLNIRSMKSPQSFRREETLKEDGTNIASVYHTIYISNQLFILELRDYVL